MFGDLMTNTFGDLLSPTGINSTDPAALRPMTEEEITQWRMRQGLQQAVVTPDMARRMMNVSCAPRQPTMTLEEWDEARRSLRKP